MFFLAHLTRLIGLDEERHYSVAKSANFKAVAGYHVVDLLELRDQLRFRPEFPLSGVEWVLIAHGDVQVFLLPEFILFAQLFGLIHVAKVIAV